jgi:ATP-binding cassette subfamily B protein
MSIAPGEKIAIIGENGAGKTTFIKRLLRLYDVTDGRILYGGRDIRDFSIHEYRQMIGAVLQDYQIYAATIGENIKMDMVDTDGDTDILERALDHVDLMNKYGKLASGLQTELTREFAEDGTVFSGGESQKVAISRLFAKSEDLPIAILDEPSSALDPVAEYNLNLAMAEKAANSMIIFISHRLSTTRDADKIYMFADGRIIEQGRHDELMAQEGRYAEMFEKQAHYYKLGL